MKNLRLLLFFMLSLPLIYSQPKFIFNINSGLCIPLQELKGDMKDSSDRVNTLEMQSGYSIGIEGKYFFGKGRNFGTTFSIGYAAFSNSEPYVNPYGNNVKKDISALNFGVGAEYAFLPAGILNPFIGAGLTCHIFNGNTEHTIEGYTIKSELEPAKRFGAALGMGFNFSVNKSIGVVAGGKYHLANLLGKDYDTTKNLVNKYFLQDAGHILTDGFFIYEFEYRRISYLQFYFGVSYSFGQPKAVKK